MKDCLLVAMVSFGSQDCGFGLPPVFIRIEDPDIRGLYECLFQ